MKMICDVPDEVIKCIKDGTWCGSSVAEKMIANGIPLSSSEKPNKCEDAISREAVIDSIHANCVYENEYNLTAKHIEDAVKQLPPVNPQKPKTDWIVSIILTDEKGEEHDGLMDMRRMLIYLHNIPAETAMSLGYTWKSAEGSEA